MKNGKFLFIVFCFISFICCNNINISQNNSKNIHIEDSLNQEIGNDENESILVDPMESMPVFPGGVDSLKSFLKSNLIATSEMREMGVFGKVIIQLIVEKDGTITDPFVLRGIDKLFDAEALRVVKLLPKFEEPAYINNVAVRSKYVIPIPVEYFY